MLGDDNGQGHSHMVPLGFDQVFAPLPVYTLFCAVSGQMGLLIYTCPAVPLCLSTATGPLTTLQWNWYKEPGDSPHLYHPLYILQLFCFILQSLDCIWDVSQKWEKVRIDWYLLGIYKMWNALQDGKRNPWLKCLCMPNKYSLKTPPQ